MYKGYIAADPAGAGAQAAAEAVAALLGPSNPTAPRSSSVRHFEVAMTELAGPGRRRSGPRGPGRSEPRLWIRAACPTNSEPQVADISWASPGRR